MNRTQLLLVFCQVLLVFCQVLLVFCLNFDNSDQAVIPRVRFNYTTERSLFSNGIWLQNQYNVTFLQAVSCMKPFLSNVKAEQKVQCLQCFQNCPRSSCTRWHHFMGLWLARGQLLQGQMVLQSLQQGSGLE